MRIAFTGKGGVGKSLVAGTFARLLARAGRSVLVVDSDPLPGLAYSLGIDRSDAGTLDDAVVDLGEDARPRFALREDLSPEGAVERYALRGPDGVRLVQLAKTAPGGPVPVRSASALRLVVRELPAGGCDIIGDLPGGTRQPFFGWAGYAEVIAVVVEPTAASALAARRLARLGGAKQAPRVIAVANKVIGPDDADGIAARTGLAVVASVPTDPAVAAAERGGVALLDHAPDSPAARAIASLVRGLADADDLQEASR